MVKWTALQILKRLILVVYDIPNYTYKKILFNSADSCFTPVHSELYVTYTWDAHRNACMS